MASKRSGGRGDVVMHFQHPDGFNPNDTVYKSCCCHSKTFTIFVGIFEIFTICFLLVAVLPDLTTRVCDRVVNETDVQGTFDNLSMENVHNVTYIVSFLCQNNIACLIWPVTQITAVIGMFYGIKTIRFWLFIPHFILRVFCLFFIVFIEIWVIIHATSQPEESVPYIITIVVFAIVGVGTVYATWVEIRCAHFVKRSRETGFSISVARPVGPATISLSENLPNANENSQPTRRLPPLRHNQNQYIVNETAPPAPGNPNETNNR